MDRYMHSILDVIVDRSPEGLIGAILVALVLSLVVSGAFVLLRTRVSDTSVLLTCLVLTANVVAMAIAGGYVQFASGRPRIRNGPGMMPRDERFFPGGPGRGSVMAGRILAVADADHDGILSPEEAVVAAEKFVKQVGQGQPVDEEMLRTAIWERMGPPGFMAPPHPVEAGVPRLGAGREHPSDPPDHPTAR